MALERKKGRSPACDCWLQWARPCSKAAGFWALGTRAVQQPSSNRATGQGEGRRQAAQEAAGGEL